MLSGLFNCLRAVLLIVVANTAIAAPSDDTIIRMDLSMRQATLVQAMTSAACFSMAGVDAENSGNRALEYLDQYSEVLSGLRDGHEYLGLSSESRPEIRAAITRTNAVWQTYRPAIQQIVAGDYHAVIMEQILRKNTPVVDASNQLAKDLMTGSNTTTFDPEFADALVFAANHRMLSQRVMLEACYVLTEIGGEDMSARMQLTLEEIDAGFSTLVSGDGAIPPPPNMRIESNYSTAMLYWGRVQPALEKIASGEAVEADDLVQTLKFAESVFGQLNEALEAYATAAAQS